MTVPPTSPSLQSDPLAEAADRARINPVALAGVRNWLSEQLVAQEYAKLGQGGHTNNEVPLRRVFVDLPVADRNTIGLDRTPRVLFLAQLLSADPLNLQRSLNPEICGPISSSDLEALVEPTDGHYENSVQRRQIEPGWGATLLIGGPGQGKSTLGQLACQLHRAALLLPIIESLPSKTSELLRSFLPTQKKSGQKRQALNPPKQPFLPFQIALPDLAAWMSKEPVDQMGENVPVLLHFLANLPSAKTYGLSAKALFELATQMPSLVVLDGFDEVGATQDRERVVSAARELLTALAQRSAFAQILATTRPQGYSGELSRIGIPFHDRHLAQLSIEEALEYAEKLVDAKIPSADLRRTTITRLREAAAEPATRRLLSTPLQVTILTALVQHIGRAPRERWNLFYRYFSYTYDREIERNTYASGLLADHRAHIERIHARVALLLQVEAERDGGASARMPRSRLEEIIDAVLLEDEVSEEERVFLVREIAKAAELRLVFLVEPEPGSFGFEIRSLQEFMAAWAITSGRDSEVEARLQQVSKAPMFRNVVLFATSRLFSEGSPLRDILADRICGGLDEDPEDEVSRLIHAGAMLALETLEEGAALSQPKRARALMERAVGLLHLPPGNEHLRLSRMANSDTIPVLRTTIEQGLEARLDGQKFNKVALWICLLDAINREEEWAIATGEKFWPTAPTIKSLLDACYQADLPLGVWITTKIEKSVEPVSAEYLIDRAVLPPKAGAAANWVQWLSQIFSRSTYWSEYRRPAVVNLLTTSGMFKGLKPPPTPAPASWAMWVAAADFQVDPCTKNLAMALSKIAEIAPTPAAWLPLLWQTSWPLSTCLAAAKTPDDLRRFATKIQSGELGNIEDWRQAEATWTSEPKLRTLLTNLANNNLWTKSSIKQSPPFLAVPLWRYIERAPKRISKEQKNEALFLALDAFNSDRSRYFKQRLAELILSLLQEFSTKNIIKEINLPELLSAASNPISYLVPRPKFIRPKEWIDLILAYSGQSYQSLFVPISAIFEALEESKGHPAILGLTVSSIQLHARHYFPNGRILPQQIKHYSFLLEQIDTESTLTKAYVAILKIYLGTIEKNKDAEAFENIKAAASGTPSLWSALLNSLSISHLPESRVRVLLTKLYLEMGPLLPEAQFAIERLRGIFQKRKSDLENYSTWNRLALPLPPPQPMPQARIDGGVPGSPIRIDSIEIQDIGGIQNLTIPLSQPEPGLGQWVVILGPNGIGKTTILRSIVLALRSIRHLAIWPSGAFTNQWQRIPNANDSQVIESAITIKLGDGVEHKTLLRSRGSLNISQLPEQDYPYLFPIFAYGCRRGSALGGSARQVNLSEKGGPEIATLFDEGADLIHAETWLLQLDGDAQKNPQSKSIFEAVIAALCKLLDLHSIEVADRRVWVTEHGHPRLPFNSLSDGYLTSAGWFLDLIARWIASSEHDQLTLEEDFLLRMKGLVLIDELDLHLHPQWQVEIISRTRKLLPQMSFIVTTHNPLTLVGAKAEEIWVLSSEQGLIKATIGSEAPMLLTGGQIYRRYFEIEDIYPNGLGRSLKRYSFLSGYPLRNDEEQLELNRLHQELHEAGLDPGWEVVPRSEISVDPRVITKASKPRPSKKGGKA